MILRPFCYPFISLFLFVFISCGSGPKKDSAQTPKAGMRPVVKADAYIVKKALLADKIEIPGTIVSNESTDIHPEVAGRITGIFFKEGAYVNRGTLLIKLNDADLQAQKQKLLVQIKIAEQNQNRSQQLLKIGGISRQDFENTELTVTNAKADLAVISTQIEKTNIRAPFDGKLGLRLVSLGAYVSPQTTLTTISQMNQLRIDFTVPEVYIPKINLGQYVNFTVEGTNRTYAARVTATQSNITSSTRTLQVRATIQGYQKELVPGNFARVTINFEPDPNAIVVPSQAIVPQARGKNVFVYENGKSKSVEVTTGLRDSANVQITSGLKAGDTVLITGLLSLKPDGNVSLGKIVNETNQPVQSTGSSAGKKQNNY